ncbi:MAG: RCC1 domain-containing protein [Chloroflexota bacterium]|nr:RCC1 domain-containing protein [Chloroflexota bacterium]
MPDGRYKAVSAIGGRTCALTEAGEAVCWGSASERKNPSDESPDPPPGVYRAIDVSYSYDGFGSYYWTTCAVTETNEVVCWGAGNTQVPYVHFHRGSYDVALASGSGFCGLTTAGQVTCTGGRWAPHAEHGGSGRFTAIGESHTFQCAITDTGRAICNEKTSIAGSLRAMNPPDPSPHRFMAVSVGRSHACALTDLGEAVCWAEELLVTQQPEPRPGRYVAVSDGPSHTCALTADGEAVCWGWNNFGQLDVPPGTYTAVTAGDLHTCALTEAGEVVCWGYAYGVPPSGPYTAIDAGYGQTCAITAAHEAICWWNEGGTSDPLPGDFVSISVGWSPFACGLLTGGSIVCWGEHHHAEIDAPEGSYHAVDAGTAGACALSEGGDVVCWGDAGALARTSPAGRYVAISVGRNAACALTEEGAATCWGSFAVYKGDPEYRVEPPPGRYAAVSVSAHRACGLTDGGDVLCWGDANHARWPGSPLQYQYDIW